MTQGSAVYAIPQDTGPMGLFYRADLFKKYGLTVPTTWAQYLSDAKKLHAATPERLHRRLPGQRRPVVRRPRLAGRGASGSAPRATRWVTGIDDSPSVQVANFWQQLISDHLVKVEPDFASEWYKDLSDGTLLTWPTAVWGENTLVTNAAATKGDWRVAADAQLGQPRQPTATGAARPRWCSRTASTRPRPLQFAEWLNTNPQSITGLITKGGLYPADLAGQKQPAANSPVAFYGGQNIWQVFQANGKLVNTSFQWGPIMSTTFTQMADGFGKSTGGSGSLAQVLTSTQSQTVSTMKSQGFSVKAAEALGVGHQRAPGPVAPREARRRRGDPSAPATGRPAVPADGRRVGWAPAMFLAPFGVLFALFFLLPIGYAIYESFLKVHVSGLGLGPELHDHGVRGPGQLRARSSPTRRSGRAWGGYCCSGWSRSRSCWSSPRFSPCCWTRWPSGSGAFSGWPSSCRTASPG